MTRIDLAVLVAILTAFAAGCGGTEPIGLAPTSTPFSPSTVGEVTQAVVSPAELASPTPIPATTSTVQPSITTTPAGYDSNAALNEIFPAFSMVKPNLAEKLDQVVAENDESLVPFLIEILRFMPTTASRDIIGQALRDLTGEAFESSEWDEWMEWLGQNGDRYQPPSAYVHWKARTYAAIDPRMSQFIRPAAEFSRIELMEVVWGGVVTDGIPDLRNPPTLSPHEAEYLLPDDRVFGVHINGESKAYPLRIVNAHEMVNDQVGGEPISLMW